MGSGVDVPGPCSRDSQRTEIRQQHVAGAQTGVVIEFPGNSPAGAVSAPIASGTTKAGTRSQDPVPPLRTPRIRFHPFGRMRASNGADSVWSQRQQRTAVRIGAR